MIAEKLEKVFSNRYKYMDIEISSKINKEGSTKNNIANVDFLPEGQIFKK